jgi:site-specific DNA-methyltransferase (adenine-specific)
MHTVIHGDCLIELRKLKDKSVDLLCTDPPYGLGIARTGQIGKRRFTPKDWDVAPRPEYFIEMQRVSKSQIIWGGNYFAHMLPPSQCWLVWWKKDGLPRLSFAECEMAWTSFKKPARVFNCRWSGCVKDSKEPSVAHPTQKALELMKWCIHEFSDPGHLVLDPFLGSGTTAVAAQLLGRSFIGIERDREYIDIARKRIKEGK